MIVGSSAAALTGLQFVVIALIAESERRSSIREVDAFGTPTVVHFSAVLLVSAIMSAPWHSLRNVSLVIAASGIGGVVYEAIVVRRALLQKGYRPVLEDWIWHVVLPTIAYLFLVIAAFPLSRRPEGALFIVGAVVLLLLFVGIHNAWDMVTYIAVTLPAGRQNRKSSKESSSEESVEQK